MSGRSSTTAIAVALAGIAVGAVGCSGDKPSGPGAPVVAAIQQLQEAFVDGDAASICDRMTRPAQKQAGSVAHRHPRTCEPDIRRAFKLIEDGDGWGQGDKPMVTHVVVKDRRATARLEEGAWAADVPLIEERGTWKLAGFFGVDPAEFERIRDKQAGPFPATRGRSLEVVDGDGRRCPSIFDRRYSEVSGRCSFKAMAKDVPIRMLTPFGDFEFGACDVAYAVFVDREGRTWSDDWTFEYDKPHGCSDITPCIGNRYLYRPWKGRLVSDGEGGYLHHMDMCLKTCIGLFAGDFVMRLVRNDKGWSVEPTDQGATGFKLDKELTVTGNPFEVRER